MARRRKSNRARRSPDDYFAAGPLEFARFGKLTVGRSRLNPEQSRIEQAKMADELPTIVAEIDALVARIADCVAGFPPERLLHRAWWDFAITAIPLDGKNVDELDQMMAARMVEYVQSIIASVGPRMPSSEDFSDADWDALKENVKSLFTRLTGDYQMCLTASMRAQDPNLDMELEEFRFRAEGLWMNIRGKRDQPHETQALLDLLTAHSDVLIRLFGIDAPTLVRELGKVLAKLTRGLDDLAIEMLQFQKETVERLERVAGEPGVTDAEALRDRVFKDPDLAARRDKVFGEMFGLDLFDVEKATHLPTTLLAELAWSPGEDDEFFAAGAFRG